MAQAPVIREATLADEGAFCALWWEYLVELDKRGAITPATSEALAHFVDVWHAVVTGRMDGVSLIVPDVAVSLWGPPAPVPVKGGPLMTGQGTYVRTEHRRSGVGAAMYARGFEMLRAKGYRLFAGSVDAGNDLGDRNAERLKSRVIQVTRVVEL